MTNSNIDEVGVRAVVQDLNKYLSGFAQMDAANQRLVKSQLSLAASSDVSARRQVTALASIANAQRSSAETVRATAFQIESAQIRLKRAIQDKSALTDKSSPRAAIRAQRELEDATRGATNAIEAGGARRAAAEATVQAAIRQSGNIAAASAVAQVRGQIAVIQAGGKAVTTVNLLSRATGAFGTVMSSVNTVSQKFGQLLIAMTGFGNRLAVAFKFGAAAATAFTAAFSIGSASKFQDTLTKIDNLTNASAADVAKLGKEFLTLSKTVPSSPDELGAAAYIVLSSGIDDVNTALAITEQAAKASAAGLGNVTDVVRTVTGIINAYGKENISAAQATDILFAAVREGSADADDFAQNIGRVTQIAANLGIEFDQVAAATAVLTNVGIPAHQAITALLGVLNQLISPSKEAQQALADAGTSIQALRSEVREKGLVPALVDMLHAFGNNQAIIEELFPDVRGLSGALALLNKDGAETVRIQNNISKSSGIVDQSFRNSSKNLSFQAKILRNDLNRAFIQLGTAVLPTLIGVLKDLDGFLKRNEQAIIEFVTNGLKIAIETIKDFISGILLFIKGINTIKGVIAAIVGPSHAAAIAIAAIGTALLWALPGGPLIKGLLIVTTLLGALNKADTTGNRGLFQRESVEGNVRELLKGQGGVSKALSKVTPNFLQSDEFKAAEKEVARLKELGITTVEQYDALQKQLKATGDTAEDLGDQELKKLIAQFNDTSLKAGEFDDELKKLAGDFISGSEAAGQIKSLTAELGLFGEVSKELADKLGLTATQAGNVQGIDAVVRAEQRAQAQSFSFAAALSTVAQALQKSAAVANQIVLSLAQSALSASQQAAQNLFSNPTREVANLNVKLSQAQLSQAKTAASTNPQITALQNQLASINAQIARQQQQSQQSQQSAQKQQQQANDQAQKAADQAQDAARAQLDALKLANLQAQIAYERMNDNLEKLIDETKLQASDLQEAFLKSNEAIQNQINQAIGRGDTTTALTLVDQQRSAAKAYQSQAKALQDNEQQLTSQQKALRLEENERERQAQLAEAAAEAQARQTEAIIKNTESSQQQSTAFDDNTSSVTDNTAGLQAQAEKIQKQIASLGAVNDKSGEQVSRIQEQIDVYEAQTNVLKAQIQAADQTLLTQKEQADAAKILIGQIYIESGIVKQLSNTLGLSLIPGMDEAAKKFDLLTKALAIIQDPSQLKKFIDEGIDPATVRLGIMAENMDKVNEGLGKIPSTLQQIATSVQSTTQQMQQSAANFEASTRALFNNFVQGIQTIQKPPAANNLPPLPGVTTNNLGGTSSVGVGAVGHSFGGIFSRPHIGIVAESGIEAVVPFNNQNRARQIIAQFPPSLLAGLTKSKSQAVFAPNINVSGETLETMEVTAIRAVQRAFRDARSASSRSGGLITQGIGPSVR